MCRAAARRLLDTLVALCLAGVAGHHLHLLWLRLASGRLFDPDIAARWAAALFLALALVGLRRSGASLLWGRRALAYWLAVLLFHGIATGPAAAPGDEGQLVASEPALLFWSASVVSLLLAGAALRSGRLTRRPPPLGAERTLIGTPAEPARRPVWLFQLAPRAPPA